MDREELFAIADQTYSDFGGGLVVTHADALRAVIDQIAPLIRAGAGGPLLGLATTEEMFREIIARFTTPTAGSVGRALLLAEMLGGLDANTREYRTVDQ